MFTKDGLNISKDGYFYTRYSMDRENYESCLLELEDIEEHLLSPVTLHNTLVKDIFLPIIDSKIFSTVFARNHWDDLMDEIKNNPWPDYNTENRTIDDIEYVEVYDVTTYNKKEKHIDNTMGILSFHGLSFIAENDSSLVKKGNRQQWSISPQPISDYMNYPLVIGKFSLYDDTTNKPIIEDSCMTITLFSLLQAIIFDMSFYGVKEARKRKSI